MPSSYRDASEQFQAPAERTRSVHADAKPAQPVLRPDRRAPFSAADILFLQKTSGNRSIDSIIGNVNGRQGSPATDRSAWGRGGAVDVQRLGTPLNQPLPSSEPIPAHGEKSGKQRRYTPAQYMAM